MKIYCVIPAYNEQGNILKLTNKLLKSLNKTCDEYKILFVIQGEDGSLETIKNLKNKQVTYVYFKKPLGIGFAYKIGFKKIPKNFEYILTLDADLNHDPQVVGDFIKKIKETRADIVIGSRFVEGGKFFDNRFWKRVISLWVNKLVVFIFGIKVHDISSGYRLIKRQVIDKLGNRLSEKGYPGYMELIVKANRANFKIVEVPIIYEARVWGESKMSKTTTLFQYLKFLTKHILFSENPN